MPFLSNRLLYMFVKSMAVLWVTVLFVPCLVRGFSERNDFEYALRKSLFTNYTKSCQPIRPIPIQLGVAFSNLKNMTWQDSRLKWDPILYNNITQIRVLMKEIWTPDVFLYFATGNVQEFGKEIEGSLKFGASLNKDGHLFFSQPTTIHASCEVDIANYPFDDQICELTFGCWSNDLSQVDVQLYKNTGLDQSMYNKHNEWEIISAKVTRQVNLDASSRLGYPRAVMRLYLRRNALFYLINYVLPSVVIAVLSLLVFLIPPEVGKRMEAGINLLLCLSVYLMLVNSKMPITSKSFPLLTKFYGCTIVILVISLCCSCWVYSFYFMNPSGWDVYQIPRWLQVVLFGYLYPVLYWSPFKCCKKKEDSIALDFENIPLDELCEASSGLTTQQHVEESCKEETLNNMQKLDENSQGKGKSLRGLTHKPLVTGNVFFIKSKDDITEEMNESRTTEVAIDTKEDYKKASNKDDSCARKESTIPSPPQPPVTQDPHLMYMAETVQMDSQKLLNKEKWKSAAMVLNRLFIVLLVISITASFLGCFMSSPRLLSDS